MPTDKALSKQASLKALKKFPAVGDAVAEDLWNLGIRQISDLQGKDPQSLYEQLCMIQNTQVDRCMLYVFRCAVYYASQPEPDPEKLKWWYWKD